ncbi:MAG: NAD(P)/FAD-dependent oxidoreductase [Dehalococcoidales bacterium]|nr:NAD(P)/FAD-dependent oxidoreductase [Dehalococcoidales bacterium]
MKKQVIVIGAGAGGMMAAGHAAELGANVLLLEKTERPGKKILISGNGRCNLTNSRDLESFIAQYGANGRFLTNVFSRFFRDELLAFLHRYGVETMTEPEGKIYPVSQNAREIVRVFESYLVDNNVTLQLNTRVNHILVEDKKVVGVQTITNVYPCSAVILATGGTSHPQTGSTGDGYRIAKELGHTITKLRPSLAPLVVAESELAKSMMGSSLHNARLTAFQCRADEIEPRLVPAQDTGRGIMGKKPKSPVIESRFGNAIITHFGLSGPVILEMSLAITDAQENSPVSVSIDLKPEISKTELISRLQQEFKHHSKRTYQTIMKSFLSHKMIEPFITLSGIPGDKQGNQIKSEERDRIAGLLKSLRFNIKGSHSMSTAMVTAGGLSLDEIDPKTMASKIVSGLYFCGEVMDIDALTGGYNLQAAFSTGWVAGGEVVK